MKNIQYSVSGKETGNASGKAKMDAFIIAREMGFQPSYKPSSFQVVRVLQQIFTMFKFHGRKVIFFQYPAVNHRMMELFGRVVSEESVKIALVHDLRSIQGIGYCEKEKEIRLLNIFDYLIVHNVYMEKYVTDYGYRGTIVCLDLFDYLHDSQKSINEKPFSNSISFAGNLAKAGFLKEIYRIHSCNFLLYGKLEDQSLVKADNIQYRGLLPSDEIPYLMEGDYGLVWDGESASSCTGVSGEYLKYNNPHKFSLCMAAGKPVITWKKAAIADFVEKHQVGIVVDSLEELNDIDLENNYCVMKQNVMLIKNEVANGFYLKRALNSILQMSN